MKVNRHYERPVERAWIDVAELAKSSGTRLPDFAWRADGSLGDFRYEGASEGAWIDVAELAKSSGTRLPDIAWRADGSLGDFRYEREVHPKPSMSWQNLPLLGRIQNGLGWPCLKKSCIANR